MRGFFAALSKIRGFFPFAVLRVRMTSVGVGRELFFRGL
jgi:hypothetical protein